MCGQQVTNGQAASAPAAAAAAPAPQTTISAAAAAGGSAGPTVTAGLAPGPAAESQSIAAMVIGQNSLNSVNDLLSVFGNADASAFLNR